MIKDEDITTIISELVQFVNKHNRNRLDNLLPTAVLLTGINQTDHYDQFNLLANELKNNNCDDVVVLQSRDCSSLKTAFQKLVSCFIENTNDNDNMQQKCLKRSEYTMKTLHSWWMNKSSSKANQSLVVILPDFELFNMNVFQKIIIILSSYRAALPIVLIIGVATAQSTLQDALPHRIINNLQLKVFQVEQSSSILNKVKVKYNYLFVYFKFIIYCLNLFY